jgi:hypothetical protein
MSTFTFIATFPEPETSLLVSELVTVEAPNAQEAELKATVIVFGVNTFVDGWLELA